MFVGTVELQQDVCALGVSLHTWANAQMDAQTVAMQMDDCKLTERSGPWLEDMLLSTRTLKYLSLAWNNLGAGGAGCLARGLEANFSLETLLLPWTGISDLGCCHIAAALKSNVGLVQVDLSGDNAGYNTSVVIAEMLTSNNTLRKIILHNNPLTQEGIRMLIKAMMAQVWHCSVPALLQWMQWCW
jgi:Ran GTPase-activating protein (RanGAP) involved in mRNA processing and transport